MLFDVFLKYCVCICLYIPKVFIYIYISIHLNNIQAFVWPALLICSGMHVQLALLPGALLILLAVRI